MIIRKNTALNYWFAPCQAIKEAHQAYWKASKPPRFRSSKNPTQSYYIPKNAIKACGIYPRVSGKDLRYSESLPETPLDK